MHYIGFLRNQSVQFLRWAELRHPFPKLGTAEGNSFWAEPKCLGGPQTVELGRNVTGERQVPALGWYLGGASFQELKAGSG